MEQLPKIHPIAPAIVGHRVIISDKIFSEIINVINLQSEVINSLIDKTNSNTRAIATLDSSLTDLADALTKI